MSEIKYGHRAGHSEMSSTDTTGKRIASRCSCGRVRIVAADDLRTEAGRRADVCAFAGALRGISRGTGTAATACIDAARPVPNLRHST